MQGFISISEKLKPFVLIISLFIVFIDKKTLEGLSENVMQRPRNHVHHRPRVVFL